MCPAMQSVQGPMISNCGPADRTVERIIGSLLQQLDLTPTRGKDKVRDGNFEKVEVIDGTQEQEHACRESQQGLRCKRPAVQEKLGGER